MADKQIVVYPHIRIVLNNKKGTNDTGNNMDESQHHLLSEISLEKGIHTVQFHLYEILESAI